MQTHILVTELVQARSIVLCSPKYSNDNGRSQVGNYKICEQIC